MLDIQGLLIDIDGVLHVAMRPIPGAAAALRTLRAHGVPFRLLTNTTVFSRASLAAALEDGGFHVAPEELLTAARASAAYISRRWPGARCFLIAKGDVAVEFQAAGLHLVPDEAPGPVDVVVIGGAEERLTYERLNRAYRLLLDGAKLVAMHRNRSWRTAAGMTLDSGPFVGALEEASGVRAIVVGKPAAAFFRQGLAALALPARAVAMIGDDARTDLVPARRLGMRTILVRTGKPAGPAEEAQADLVLASIAALPAALGLN